MAKNTILKVTILLLSAPYVAASRLMNRFGHKRFQEDIERCSKAALTFSERAAYLRSALVIAEDHRNEFHSGIDPIAIISAVSGRILKGKKRGASTIEQQFVRVVTERYERSIRRKVREQLIAIEICRRHEKSQIADAYLSRAFFGSGQIGVEQLERGCSTSFDKIDTRQALVLTAQLKYPKPIFPDEDWSQKIQLRWAQLQKFRQCELTSVLSVQKSLKAAISSEAVEKLEFRNGA